LRFRCLKPLAWIFGKRGRHDTYGYVCFGDEGGGIGAVHSGAAEVANGNVLCAKCDAKMSDTQLGLLGMWLSEEISQEK
jgi:hypothetical protein